jgi:hypothetical protein
MPNLPHILAEGDAVKVLIGAAFFAFWVIAQVLGKLSDAKKKGNPQRPSAGRGTNVPPMPPHTGMPPSRVPPMPPRLPPQQQQRRQKPPKAPKPPRPQQVPQVPQVADVSYARPADEAVRTLPASYDPAGPRPVTLSRAAVLGDRLRSGGARDALILAEIFGPPLSSREPRE